MDAAREHFFPEGRTNMNFQRILLAALACGYVAHSTAAEPPTATEIVERIKTHVNCPWTEPTSDTFKAGNPQTRVTGIASTFMATQTVLEQAVETNCNLIITHEPTFYVGNDEPTGLVGDAVLMSKRAFIEKHGLVIWRFHDHAHRHKPDLIDEGMIDGLGLREFLTSRSPYLFTVPETAVRDLAVQLKQRLGAKSLDIVGDPELRVHHVAFAAGSPSPLVQMQLLQRDDVEVLLTGETREWETVPYVQDTAAQGQRKAMILLGHANSEEAGMRHVANWLSEFIDEVPVKFIPAGDPFHDVPANVASDKPAQ